MGNIKLSYSEVTFTQLPKGHFAARFSQKVNGCALGLKIENLSLKMHMYEVTAPPMKKSLRKNRVILWLSPYKVSV